MTLQPLSGTLNSARKPAQLVKVGADQTLEWFQLLAFILKQYPCGRPPGQALQEDEDMHNAYSRRNITSHHLLIQ